jgi:transposase
MKFRENRANQLWLIPPDIEDEIPKDDISRTIKEVVEELNFETIEKRYKEVGNVGYEPKTLFKIIIYSYTNKIYSYRKMAKESERNIYYWYLTGKEKPDFRTLWRFVDKHKKAIRELFEQVVQICEELGMIKLENVAIDGSKIRANASKDGLDRRKEIIKEIIRHSGNLNRAEDQEYGKDKRGDELPEEIRDMKARQKRIKEIVQKKINKGQKDTECQIMKTSQNGFQAAYNTQISVDEKQQVIVNADVITEPNDANALIEQIEGVKKILNRKPQRALADAGYANVNNAKYLESEKIEAIIADKQIKEIKNIMEKQKIPLRKGIYAKEMFEYMPEEDLYICPAQQKLYPSKEYASPQKNAVVQKRIYYNYAACTTCQKRNLCTKNKCNFRSITRRVDETSLDKLKATIRTERGYNIYKKRMKIVEPVFGNIKWNKGFNRFSAKGLARVKTQFFLACFVHNIEKINKYLGKTPRNRLFARLNNFVFLKKDFFSFKFTFLPSFS